MRWAGPKKKKEELTLNKQTAEDFTSPTKATAPARVTPFDRLPCPFFGAPPLASLYHTKRADSARQRAEADVPEELAVARQELFAAGLRRGNPAVADVADHNAMTLAWALRYAAVGLHVIDSHAIEPRTGYGTEHVRELNPGKGHAKHPRGAGWDERFTTDRATIIDFWCGRGEYPPDDEGNVFRFAKPNRPRNVSICFPEGCGLFVLDEDGAEGIANREALEREHGALPRTVKSISGSGTGAHYIFRCRKPIRNSASAIAPKLDIRGEGGQIIAAPSIHKTGGFYRWADGCAPGECEIAEAPEWLEDLIHANSGASTAPKGKKGLRKRAPQGSSAPTRQKTRRSFAEWVASIGDAAGQSGFHGPIFSAARNYFAERGTDADPEGLFHILRDRIAAAPRDAERDRSKYDSDDYLRQQIDAAHDSAVAWRDDADAERQAEALTVTTTSEVRQAAEEAGINADTPEAGILAFFQRLADGGTDSVGWAAVVEVFAAERGKKNALTRLGKKIITDCIAKVRNAAKGETRPDTAGQAIVNEQHFAELCGFGQRQITSANAAEPTVFHFGDGLVRIREDSEGRLRLKVMQRDDFAHYLNSVASYAKVSGEDGELRGVSAPDDVVRHLFAADYGIYHPLVGTTEIPIFTKTGSRLTAVGYDPASRLYYRPDPTLVIPDVPDNPSDADLRKAKRILIREALGDFPLDGLRRAELEQVIDNAEISIPSLANVLALFILIFMRDMIDGPTPGHLLNKPGPGTGASLLTDLLAIVATGEEAEAQTLPESKEEVSKTLTTNVIDGQPIILFDNINSTLGGDVLASAMTSGKYSARILGKNESVKQRIRGVWVFTGNNIVLTPEMVRRFVLIYLNAGTAAPEKRTGFLHRDVKAWAKENRGELVWACLTLIQNWVAAGMPDGGYRLASFDVWARKVGGVLEAAGICGLGQNAEKLADLSESGEQPEDYLLQRLVEDLRAQNALPSGKCPKTEPNALWLTVGDVTYQKREPINIMDMLNTFYPGEGGKSPQSLRIRGWNYNRDGIYEDAGALGKAFSARFLGDAKNDKTKTARHLVKLVHEDGNTESVEVAFSLVGKPQGAGKVYRMELV